MHVSFPLTQLSQDYKVTCSIGRLLLKNKTFNLELNNEMKCNEAINSASTVIKKHTFKI